MRSGNTQQRLRVGTKPRLVPRDQKHQQLEESHLDWDVTPGDDDSRKRNRWDGPPKAFTPGFGSGWAETPRLDRGGDTIQEPPTPSASKRRGRWDETPADASATPSGGMAPQTPSLPGAMRPRMTPGGVTPIGQKAMAMATPTAGHLVTVTPEQLQVQMDY